MNPFFISYVNTSKPAEYDAKASAIVITGRGNRYDPAFQALRPLGALLYQYWMTYECADVLTNPLDQETYYVDGKHPALWPYRDANGQPRSGWKGTHLLDIRPNQPYFGQIKKFARAQIESRKFDGFMLDGMGYRIWGTIAAWDTWPQHERDEWTACMLAIAEAIHDIRVEMWREFEIVHNNFWDNNKAPGSEIGLTYANGCVIENNPHGPWHSNYVTKTFAGGDFKKRVLVICPTPALADEWKADPNVTHITLVDKAAGQNYLTATPPLVPYMDERDPCAQCKATVAELEAENATLRVDNDTLRTDNDALRAQVAALEEDMAAIHAQSAPKEEP